VPIRDVSAQVIDKGAERHNLIENNNDFPIDIVCEVNKDFPAINYAPTQSSPSLPSEFIIIGGDDGRLYHFPSHGNGTFGTMNDIGNASDNGRR